MGLIKWLKLVLLDIDDERAAYQRGEITELESESFEETELSLSMSDEEKQRVAVIVSCIVGQQNPEAKYHIYNIKKIA